MFNVVLLSFPITLMDSAVPASRENSLGEGPLAPKSEGEFSGLHQPSDLHEGFAAPLAVPLPTLFVGTTLSASHELHLL